ncbi:MAG TPA: POTRA domain-containing protein, partial [Terriglobales bacterium]|nr:POTRA domain-containing protein [Terriglobales bacterium]
MRLGRIQFWAVLGCLCAALAAQQPTAVSAPPATDFTLYAGRPVVSLELAGQPALLSAAAQAALLAKLPQQSGDPLDVDKIQRSLIALRDVLPRDRVTAISVHVVPEVAGIRVQFLLEPAEYFGVFQFPGALRFPYLRLLEASQYTNQSPYSDHSLQAAVNGLNDFFRQEGYFQAVVSARLHSLPDQGLANVDFATTLGPRARYGKLLFQGATSAQADHMRGQLTSWTARLFRRSVIPGHAYSLQRLQAAAANLQSGLNDEGYLGAQVTLAGARYHPDTNLADITFAVMPGPLVNLHVTGAHLWPWTRHSLLPITSESSVDPLLVQDGQENLANYFASQGYFNAQVTTQVQTTSPSGETETRVTQASAAALAPPPPAPPAPATPPAAKSIVYKIDKGPRHDVVGISFSGNVFYARDDLLPLVKIETAGVFSHGNFSQALLRQSVSNIETLYQNSGYSSVAVTPDITHPGGNLAVAFKIVEGPQDFVQSLSIEGNKVSPDLFAPQGLMIGTGTPFAQQLIAQDRAQILAYYLSHGYLNATFRASAQRLTGQRHLVNVTYHISEGPQVRARRILFAGAQYTQPRLLLRLTPKLQPGAFVTETDLLTAESRLYSPGIFDWATVAPRRPITDQTNADVVVKVHEAARNSLVYGFGFDLTNRGGSVPSGTVALPGLPVVGLPSNFTTSQATFF